MIVFKYKLRPTHRTRQRKQVQILAPSGWHNNKDLIMRRDMMEEIFKTNLQRIMTQRGIQTDRLNEKGHKPLS